MTDGMKDQITYEQFAALDLRVARVLDVQPHPNADKLLVLRIDLGELGERQILAGVRPYYPPETLVGKLIVVLVNLAPRQIRGLESNGMLLAASAGQPPQDVVVLTLDRPVPPGSRIS